MHRIILLYHMRLIGVTFLVVFCSSALFTAFACTAKKNSSQEPATTEITAESVTCPVCGLTFPSTDAAASAKYKGKTYYFFLADHQKAFTLSPEIYLSPKPPAPPRASTAPEEGQQP